MVQRPLASTPVSCSTSVRAVASRSMAASPDVSRPWRASAYNAASRPSGSARSSPCCGSACNMAAARAESPVSPNTSAAAVSGKLSRRPRSGTSGPVGSCVPTACRRCARRRCRRDEAASASACNSSLPSCRRSPADRCSPSVTVRISPCCAAAASVAVPSTTQPSTGTTSPGNRRIRSPARSARSGHHAQPEPASDARKAVWPAASVGSRWSSSPSAWRTRRADRRSDSSRNSTDVVTTIGCPLIASAASDAASSSTAGASLRSLAGCDSTRVAIKANAALRRQPCGSTGKVAASSAGVQAETSLMAANFAGRCRCGLASTPARIRFNTAARVSKRPSCCTTTHCACALTRTEATPGSRDRPARNVAAWASGGTPSRKRRAVSCRIVIQHAPSATRAPAAAVPPC